MNSKEASCLQTGRCCVFLHHHKTLKKTVRESVRAVIREATTFWDRAKIPVRPEQRAISQLEQLHDRWVKLKKNASRKSDTQATNERSFVDTLGDLFDIAHMNALKIIKIPEDREFLLAQREKGRRGCMGSVDKVHELKQQKASRRRQTYEVFKNRVSAEQLVLSESAQFSSSSTDHSSTDEDSDDKKTTNSQSTVTTPMRSKRARRNVVTPDVAAALDRAKVSDRKATLLLTAAAQGLGHNPEELAINRSSIRRNREVCRSELAAHLKQEFIPSVLIVVHWDGKLLADLTGKNKVDRFPVILSAPGVCQIIGVPKLSEETGEAQASAVARLLDEWGVTDRV